MPNSGLVSGRKNSVPGAVMPTEECLWREPELGVLPGPFGRRIAQIRDANSTGQAPIDCGLHQVRRQKRERYRHIDLTDGAVFSGSDLLDIRDRSRDQLIEPMPPLRDRGDELGAGLGADWTRVLMRRSTAGRMISRGRFDGVFFQGTTMMFGFA